MFAGAVLGTFCHPHNGKAKSASQGELTGWLLKWNSAGSHPSAPLKRRGGGAFGGASGAALIGGCVFCLMPRLRASFRLTDCRKSRFDSIETSFASRVPMLSTQRVINGHEPLRCQRADPGPGLPCAVAPPLPTRTQNEVVKAVPADVLPPRFCRVTNIFGVISRIHDQPQAEVEAQVSLLQPDCRRVVRPGFELDVGGRVRLVVPPLLAAGGVLANRPNPSEGPGYAIGEKCEHAPFLAFPPRSCASDPGRTNEPSTPVGLQDFPALGGSVPM